MKGFLPNKVIIRPVFAFIGVSVLLVVSFDHALPETVDTLNLQLQWAYPIKVVDMKLVDFDHNGINEILVGFKSDSSRVGILDASSQNMLWQSPGIDFSISTVAAGDRNDDGYLDIICGGYKWNYPSANIGRIKILDGPAYDSMYSFSGFDQNVLSASICIYYDTIPTIFLGTQFDNSYGGEYWYFDERLGKLYVLNGHNFTVQSINDHYGSIREIFIGDINNDTYKELLLGMDHWETYVDLLNPVDYTAVTCWIAEYASDYSHVFNLYGEGCQGAYDGWGVFDALEVVRFNGDVSNCIIGSSHIKMWNYYKGKLACWSELTATLEWNIEWYTEDYVADLAVANYRSQEYNAICVAYASGLIEFRNGSNGSILAVSPRSHSIYHMRLGNVDQDSLVEMCTASRDSLYIYETELLQPKYRPMVSDIPNQTITEGENFTSIKLDDYVVDLDDPDSILVWSHCSESELLVNITNRVATVTPPNPDWNGAETIWFKACDPGGLCDSGQVIFTVVAVNDTPVVLDIPDQTITEHENFTSISLDEYVADPDNPDWLMVWRHWGEAALLVYITNRVVNVTTPHPEWNGAETIWFKACDPGGLCDSDQAIMTVISENDRPMISDIPNQTIVEGEGFASIRLDDYVTDPDDPDSVMVWSHQGEAGLLVDITDRVATVTPPNPEWNGAETIWFKACDPGGLCDSSKITFAVHPKRFCLLQNYPNPFNPQTNIRFDVPLASNVTITIYSILGEKVREFEKHYEAGTHTLMWNGKNSSGRDVTSGVYLYKLSAGNFQSTKKMVLIK